MNEALPVDCSTADEEFDVHYLEKKEEISAEMIGSGRNRLST